MIGNEPINGGTSATQIFFAFIVGLAAGATIGFLTEYFTGTGRRPVKAIVRATETGPATTIITGVGVGMLSSMPVVLVLGAALLGSYALAGLYGVGIAALGMLGTLGIQLAVDAYGPIADNAGGIAEMAELPPEVRRITDSLDAVGNTTAAIGKGFAVGSATLAAVSLFAAFKEQAGAKIIDIANINVLAGLFVGAGIPFFFSSLAIGAIGRAAFAMIQEVRRQFRERPGILTEEESPDYNRCIDISTRSALREMILPGLTALLAPLLVGFLGGIEMLIGLLAGVTSSGLILDVFMANSGGAWDNAKKMIESRASGGKGSDAHRAAVVGDTVGDPFKDTAGPSINILIKTMSVISLVIAPMLREYWGK
jgi:K(+)-stimulated pyrophosphate-energized sodium pump